VTSGGFNSTRLMTSFRSAACFCNRHVSSCNELLGSSRQVPRRILYMSPATVGRRSRPMWRRMGRA